MGRYLLTLAAEKGYTEKLHFISLGQGQASANRGYLEDCVGEYYRIIKGVARSCLHCSSYGVEGFGKRGLTVGFWSFLGGLQGDNGSFS